MKLKIRNVNSLIEGLRRKKKKKEGEGEREGGEGVGEAQGLIPGTTLMF